MVHYGGASSLKGVFNTHLRKINHPVIQKQRAKARKKTKLMQMKNYMQQALKGKDPTANPYKNMSRIDMSRARKAKGIVARAKGIKITAKQKSARRKNIIIAQKSRRKRK